MGLGVAGMTTKLRLVVRAAARFYTSLAVIVLGTLLLLLAVNLVAGLVLQIKAHHQKEDRKKTLGIATYRDYTKVLERVYPGMSPEQIAAIIHQTDRLCHRYEPYTQFRENPITSEFVNVDSRGFRRIRNQGEWPPPRDHLIVFTFGGSTTFGFRVSDEETIPSYLQEELNKHHGLPPCKVYNFGRMAYMSSQERVLFESLLAEGHVPDVAVFIDGLNEFIFPDGEPTYTRRLRELMASGESPGYQQAVMQLPVVKLFARSTDGNKLPRAPNDGEVRAVPASAPSQTIPEPALRYQANKRMIEVVAKAFHVTPVFVWQPVPVYGYDKRYNLFGSFNFDVHVPPLRPGYEFMADVAHAGRLGPHFIWCGDLQRGLMEPLYVDAYHYTGPFAKLLASHIAQEMVSRGLVPRPHRLFHAASPTPSYAG